MPILIAAVASLVHALAMLWIRAWFDGSDPVWLQAAVGLSPLLTGAAMCVAAVMLRDLRRRFLVAAVLFAGYCVGFLGGGGLLGVPSPNAVFLMGLGGATAATVAWVLFLLAMSDLVEERRRLANGLLGLAVCLGLSGLWEVLMSIGLLFESPQSFILDVLLVLSGAMWWLDVLAAVTTAGLLLVVHWRTRATGSHAAAAATARK